MFAKESPANDGYEGGHLLYDVVSSGRAILFKDGAATVGTWEKGDETEMIKFEVSGEEYEFARGQIWVSMIPTGNTVEY